MKTVFKRIMSFAMSAVMVVSMVGVNAIAEEVEPTLPACHLEHDITCGYVELTSPCQHSCEQCGLQNLGASISLAGDGTENSPYKISTAQELADLATRVNDGTEPSGKHYQLTANIDLSSYGSSYNNGKGWTPIGNGDHPFKGTFDGNGHKITGLYIDSSNYYIGLFGKVSGGTIKNLGVVDCNVAGNVNAGAIAGSVEFGGTITNCYTTGTVTGSNYVGGIAGANGGTVENCYTTCSVTGGTSVGGIAGLTAGGTIKNCAALNNTVKARGVQVGRVVGENSNSTFTGNIAFSEMGTDGGTNFPSDNGAETQNGEMKSLYQLQTSGGFPSVFTVSPWTYSAGKLPGLGEPVEMPEHLKAFSGAGTAENPYEIAAAKDLAKLANLVNDLASTADWADKHYKLTADINLVDYGSSYNSGKGWTPIGNQSYPFKGTFDGAGKVINNLYINDTYLSDCGLFGFVKNGTIKSLGIVEGSVTGNNFVGSVAGSVMEGTIANCYSTAEVKGVEQIGGITGYISSSTVTNCYSTGKVTGTGYLVGGVVGIAYNNNTVTSCYATGAVSGAGAVGGVAGNINEGSLANCIALNPTVKADDSDVGRVVGAKPPWNITLTGNMAFSGMTAEGEPFAGENTHDGFGGKTATVADINTARFWNSLPWDPSVWTFADRKLPILTGIGGNQTGAIGSYIVAKSIAGATFSWDSVPYTGRLYIPEVKLGVETLIKGQDYTVNITSTDGAGTSAGVNAGQVSIDITGKGDYIGTVSLSYTINKATPGYYVANQPIKAGKKLTDIQAPKTAVGMNGEILEGTLEWFDGSNKLNENYEFIGNLNDEIPLNCTFTPDSANYSSASKTVTFTITDKEIPVLNVPNIVKTYDGKAVTEMPSTATAKVGNITVEGTFSSNISDFQSIKKVTLYPITVKFTPKDSTKYETVDTTFTIAIHPAPLTIQAKSESITVGDPKPTYSAEVTGLADGETISGFTFDDDYADVKTPGAYTITPYGGKVPGGNGNYSFTYLPGTLTVSEKNSGGGSTGGSSGGNTGGDTGGNTGGNTGNTGGNSGNGSTVGNPSAGSSSSGSTLNKPVKSEISTVKIAEKTVSNSINKAISEAKKKGTQANGIGITLNVSVDKNAKTIEAILSKNSVDEMIKSGVTQLTIKNSLSDMTFDLAALKSLSGGEIRLTISKVDPKTLSAEVQKAVGNRPLLRFDVTVDGKRVSNFNGGRVGFQIQYNSSSSERNGNVCGVFVDGNGSLVWLENSSFDSIDGVLFVSTTHFSIYGIGYKQPASKFTDTANHWATDDIDFVTTRGLLSGTTESTFGPDQSITRGELEKALEKLSRKDMSKVVGGKSTATLTRQELAVIMEDYSKTIGFKLPEVHSEITFTDVEKIEEQAKSSVKNLQMAGILMGKSNNKFDPIVNATKAETSALLRRFVELLSSEKSADGWVQNDSGQWMYFQNSKPVTGKKSVDGTKYTFDKYGATTSQPPEQKFLIVTVKKGDSLKAIAKKYKITVLELAKNNGKTIFSSLTPGEEIKVPQK